MSKQILRILFKLVIAILIIQNICINNSYASAWGNIFETGQNFINEGKDSNLPINSNELKDIQDDIYNILLSLGIVLMVIIGAILGILYMFGSVEQQVKVKETLFPYIIGCIIMFSAFGIWKLVINIISSVA